MPGGEHDTVTKRTLVWMENRGHIRAYQSLSIVTPPGSVFSDTAKGSSAVGIVDPAFVQPTGQPDLVWTDLPQPFSGSYLGNLNSLPFPWWYDEGRAGLAPPTRIAFLSYDLGSTYYY